MRLSWLLVPLLALGLIGCASGSGGDADSVDGANPVPTVDERWASVCARPLAPIGVGPVTEQDFEVADAGLDKVISAADQGDVTGAHAAFLSEVHDFTHDLDMPLREKNEPLAKSLCGIVGQMESDFAFGPHPPTIAEQAAYTRDLLRQAAVELGYAE